MGRLATGVIQRFGNAGRGIITAPITWQIDVLRYATIGLGSGRAIVLESAAFVLFTLASFWAAMRALERAG